jgi:hypothetical protein
MEKQPLPAAFPWHPKAKGEREKSCWVPKIKTACIL